MPFPVCCMFLVSQNIHIKQSPNGIKTDRAYFWKIWKIRKENRHEPLPKEVTRKGPPLGHAPYPCEPTIRRLTLSPPRFRWRRNAARSHHHHRDLHQHLHHLHQHHLISNPSSSLVSNLCIQTPDWYLWVIRLRRIYNF